MKIGVAGVNVGRIEKNTTNKMLKMSCGLARERDWVREIRERVQEEPRTALCAVFGGMSIVGRFLDSYISTHSIAMLSKLLIV